MADPGTMVVWRNGRRVTVPAASVASSSMSKAQAQRMIGWNAGLPMAGIGDKVMKTTGMIPLRGEAPSDYQRTGITVRIRGWERHPVVQACIRCIVDIASAVPLQVYRKIPAKNASGFSDEIQVLTSEHPLQQLFDAPNSFMSAQRYRGFMLMHYLGYGNALTFLERPTGNGEVTGTPGGSVDLNTKLPISLRVIHPEDVTTVYVNHKGYPLWYIWLDTLGYPHTSPVQDIFHIRDLSMKGVVFGYPRGASALNDIIGDDEASQFVRQIVTNNGQPIGYAIVNEETTVEEAEQAEAKFREKMVTRGGRGSFVFMGGITDVKSLAFDLSKLEFPDLRRVAREDICFAPGTLVHTARGVVPIDRIVTGDRVLTHRGRYRAVRQVMVHEHHGEMRRLQAKGLSPVLCTPNHPWLADFAKPAGRNSNKRRRMAEPAWLAADALQARAQIPGTRHYRRMGSHRLTMPHVQTDGARIDLLRWYNGAVQEEGGRVRPANPRGTWVPRFVSLDEEFGWLFGLYLAEGSTGHNVAVWYLNVTEDGLAERATAMLARLGIEAVRRPGTKNVQIVAAHSQILRSFFAQVGNSAAVKHIPEWAMTAPLAFRRGLVQGYVDGDGNRRDGIERISTVSTSLAEQLRLLLWTDHRHGSLSHRPAKQWVIDGRSGPSLPSMVVAFPEVKAARTVVAHEDGYSAFALAQNTAEIYDGPVYNLSVDEDESYVTVGGACHNCAAFGVDPRMVGITTATRDAGLSGTQYIEARVRLIKQTIEPMMHAVESEINHWVAPEFGPDIYVRFDPDALAALAEDKDATSKRVLLELGAGARTVQETRETLELRPDYDPDDLLAPLTTVAIKTVEAALEPPAPTGGPPALLGDGTPITHPETGEPLHLAPNDPSNIPDDDEEILPTDAGTVDGAPKNKGGKPKGPDAKAVDEGTNNDAQQIDPNNKDSGGIGPRVNDGLAEPKAKRAAVRAAWLVRGGYAVMTRGVVLTPEQRQSLWKQFDERATKEEAPFRRQALQLFSEERANVAAIFARVEAKGGPDDGTMAKAARAQIRRAYKPDGEVKLRWADRFHPLIGAVYGKGADHLMESIAAHRSAVQPTRAGDDDPTGKKKPTDTEPTFDPAAGLPFDFDLQSPEVQQAVRARAERLAALVGDTTAEAISEAIEFGLQEGLSISDIAKLVDQTAFGGRDPVRATLIARTECLPADAVVDSARVTALYRRWYDGEMVTVHTRSGRKITGTTNHPVLTVTGWVGLGHLREGDHLICHARDVEQSSTASDGDVDHAPATIGEIYDAAAAVLVAKREATGQPDFHGDGGHGDVDILHPDGVLLVRDFAPITERSVEGVLAPSGMAAVALSATRAALCRDAAINHGARGLHIPALDSGVVKNPGDECHADIESSTERLGRFSRLICTDDSRQWDISPETAPAMALREVVGFGGASGTENALLPENGSDLFGASVLGESDIRSAHAAEVEIDDVVSIVRTPFSGHVYNLTTVDGYFLSGGIYTSNTVGALNQGEYDTASSTGIIEGKEWLTQGDDRVRDTHYACEREGMIALDDRFATNGMLYPGDQDGPPEEVIQCRCTLTYYDSLEAGKSSLENPGLPMRISDLPTYKIRGVEYALLPIPSRNGTH